MSIYTKPFEVVIRADVSSTENYKYRPAKFEGESLSMEYAVAYALESFRSENNGKTVKIHEVTVRVAGDEKNG